MLYILYTFNHARYKRNLGAVGIAKRPCIVCQSKSEPSQHKIAENIRILFFIVNKVIVQFIMERKKSTSFRVGRPGSSDVLIHFVKRMIADIPLCKVSESRTC